MKILMDLHTHTLVSGHAYSSLEENIQAAKEKGLTYLGTSEHGPKMPGSPHIFYFQNMRVIPRELKGIRLLRGVEANILDSKGTIDMTPETLKFIDYVIASMHIPTIKPASMEANTKAIIEAMKNPKVVIIGHPDDTRYPLDYEKLVKAAKKYKVMLEINNSSLNPQGFRQNAQKNVETMLSLCKEENIPVILGSDAHISADIGNYKYILPILDRISFPNDLIMNAYPEKFLELIDFSE